MVPKPYMDIARNENCISVSLIYKDVKILKKLMNQRKKYIEIRIHHGQVRLIPGMQCSTLKY